MSGKPGGKKRFYQGVSGKRPDLKKVRQAEAIERLTAWQALSLEERVAILDRRGVEAKKQRARLIKLVEKQAENNQ